MGKSKLILTKLTEIIVTFLKESPQLKLDNQKLTRDKDNIWSKISFSYFKTFEYSNSCNIYSWWNRNTQGLKDVVEKKLLEISKQSNEMKFFENKKKIIIQILPQEWLNLKKFISKSERKKFNCGFENILNKKIQELNVKCLLKCSYNWFGNVKNKKINSSFWSGVYYCIECQKKFTCKINQNINEENLTLVKIEIIFNESKSHECFIKKAVRCSGEQRNEQKKNIMVDGLTNSLSSNVIYNQGVKDFRG